MKKSTNIYSLVLPNRGINIFVYSIMILGILSGSIFLVISSEGDKNTVISQIQNFFVNVGNNNIDSGLALRNSLIINYIFIGGIFILGFSMIGVVLGIFLLYLKGFLVGFSLSSIFITYKYKGLLAGIMYMIPSQIINILLVILITIYSIMFSRHLFKVITSKKSFSSRVMLKKYLIIFLFCLILSFISSMLEVYVFPSLLRQVIKFYV